MKIAFAGKGGVGKTSLAAWTADRLARSGRDVWMVDADTALSLGQASGLAAADLPVPLIEREDLVRERIGSGILNLTPDVGDLPETLAVEVPLGGPALNGGESGKKRLLVMGSVAGAGGGCACSANALLKAVLAHLVMNRDDHVIVDLEAGVEHLGRGTVEHVDALIVVSEPSRRGLETAGTIGGLARDLGLTRQALVLNRCEDASAMPAVAGLPPLAALIPPLPGLIDRQLTESSVLGLPEDERIGETVDALLRAL